MIRTLIDKIWKQEGQEEFYTPKNTQANFILTYKNDTIGYLKLTDGEWLFEYSGNFKNQDKIQKLVDFPDINKQYKSPELWPFFSSRIPGLGQPKVQDAINKYQIDKGDEVELLKIFGNRTISNPFSLSLV